MSDDEIAREAADAVLCGPASEVLIVATIAAAIQRSKEESYPNLYHELARQRGKQEEAIAVLKALEWEGNYVCRVCYGLKTEGHYPHCTLAKAIGK